MTRFKDIGGLARSRPSCVSWNGSARVDCLYRGEGDAIFHQTIQDGTASEPVSIGGHAYRDVQCVSLGLNTIDCIISNEDVNLMSAYWRGSTWSNWTLRAGGRLNEVGRSSCASRDGGLTCLVRREGDGPAVFVNNGDYFSGFTGLDGTYHSPFTCVSTTNDSIDCYVSCYDNRLCCRQWRRPGGWSRNIRVGNRIYITSEPTSVVSSETRNHVFSLTANNRMIHVVFTEGSGFSSPRTIEGVAITESPECVASGTQDIYCFALGFDHYLYKTHYDGSNWSDWELLGGAFQESPSCVLYDTNQIYCFARNFWSSLVHIVYNV